MGSGVGCGGARQRCRQVHKGGAWHNNIRPGDLTKHASSAGGSAHNTVDLPSVLPSPRWCKASHRRRTAHDRTPHFHLTTTHDVERNNDNNHTNHTTTKNKLHTNTYRVMALEHHYRRSLRSRRSPPARPPLAPPSVDAAKKSLLASNGFCSNGAFSHRVGVRYSYVFFNA